MSKWERVKLGDVCTVNPSKKKTEPILPNTMISFIPMSHVSDDGNIITDNSKPFSEVSNGYSYFIEEDVLFAKITPCMENGKGAIARGLINGLGVGSTEFHILRPKKDLVTSDWIYRFTSNKKFRKLAERHMTGSAGQKRVPSAFLENALIPLPSLHIQDQVVKTLDSVSELLSMRKQQLAELDNLIKSIFYYMFGDPIINEKEWVLFSLGELLENVRYGTSIPPLFSDKGYFFIRATNIKAGRINEKDMKYIQEAEATKISKCKLLLGDLIVVRSGINTGDSCVISEKYAGHYAGYDMIITPDKTKINSVYLNELLNSSYLEIVVKPLTRRAAQPHLNAEQIRKIPIILPPLALQNQFAEIVAKIEEQKALVKKAVDETQLLFDSLMSQYFDD